MQPSNVDPELVYLMGKLSVGSRQSISKGSITYEALQRDSHSFKQEEFEKLVYLLSDVVDLNVSPSNVNAKSKHTFVKPVSSDSDDDGKATTHKDKKDKKPSKRSRSGSGSNEKLMKGKGKKDDDDDSNPFAKFVIDKFSEVAFSTSCSISELAYPHALNCDLNCVNCKQKFPLQKLVHLVNDHLKCAACFIQAQGQASMV